MSLPSNNTLSNIHTHRYVHINAQLLSYLHIPCQCSICPQTCPVSHFSLTHWCLPIITGKECGETSVLFLWADFTQGEYLGSIAQRVLGVTHNRYQGLWCPVMLDDNSVMTL